MSLPNKVEIACPSCRRKVTVKVGRNDPKVQKCPNCSALLDAKELIAGFEKSNKELAALERQFKDIGFK